MALQGNKAVTAFKTLDIKTALLSSGNRKRKAVSPQICKSETKCLKLSNESNEGDCEILDETCGIKITLQKKELVDCKENKYVNTTKLDSPVSDLNQNKSCEKDEAVLNINVSHNRPKAVIIESPKSADSSNISKKLEKNLKVSSDSNLGDSGRNKAVDVTEINSSLSDSKKNIDSSRKDEISSHLSTSFDGQKSIMPKSPKSDDSNSDNDIELLSENAACSNNSSAGELDNSVNASFNTSGLSVTGEDENEEKETNVGSKLNSELGENSNMKRPSNDIKPKTKKKKMTSAEALKKAEEREQKMNERLQKKQEYENKKKEKMLEKERKLKEKLMRREREELERKERERVKQEKKEQEEKEKQEKIKLKQMLVEQKLEEKKRKEEMRLKKEEELKKAEEEKLKAKLEKEQKEQKEKEKKERAKAAFAKFFVRGEPNTSLPPAQPVEKEGAFLPFEVSDDMTLAPVVPLAAQERFDKKQLDHFLTHQDSKELYLQILKSGLYKDVRQRKKNRTLGASDADVIVIDKNAQAQIGLSPKLLQFHQNVRPPYWGTWRKMSKSIRPRNPFGEDPIFDYDVDSDDEWDEGGPGESLSGTEPEDESEDDYDIDNEFFVPHGYLSEEEEKNEDDDEEVNDPEKQKALLKLKLQQFEIEHKKKTTELKPIILGCYFVEDSAFQDNGLQVFLQSFAAEHLCDGPIPTFYTVKNLTANNNDSPTSSNCNSANKRRVLQLPEEAFPSLIRHIHGNITNIRSLTEEFQKFWSEQSSKNQELKEATEPPTNTNLEVDASKENVGDQFNKIALISLKQLRQTIREIASYCKPPDLTFNKRCWWVHDAIREKYGLTDIPISNHEKNVSKKEPEPPNKLNCPPIKAFLSHN